MKKNKIERYNHCFRWSGSGSLVCFEGLGSVCSNIDDEFVRGTNITEPSAACCKLHSYGEYGLPSGSLNAWKINNKRIIIKKIKLTSLLGQQELS